MGDTGDPQAMGDLLEVEVPAVVTEASVVTHEMEMPQQMMAVEAQEEIVTQAADSQEQILSADPGQEVVSESVVEDHLHEAMEQEEEEEPEEEEGAEEAPEEAAEEEAEKAELATKPLAENIKVEPDLASTLNNAAGASKGGNAEIMANASDLLGQLEPLEFLETICGRLWEEFSLWDMLYYKVCEDLEYPDVPQMNDLMSETETFLDNFKECFTKTMKPVEGDDKGDDLVNVNDRLSDALGLETSKWEAKNDTPATPSERPKKPKLQKRMVVMKGGKRVASFMVKGDGAKKIIIVNGPNGPTPMALPNALPIPPKPSVPKKKPVKYISRVWRMSTFEMTRNKIDIAPYAINNGVERPLEEHEIMQRLKNANGQIEIFICDKCGKEYIWLDSLKQHQQWCTDTKLDPNSPHAAIIAKRNAPEADKAEKRKHKNDLTPRAPKEFDLSNIKDLNAETVLPVKPHEIIGYDTERQIHPDAIKQMLATSFNKRITIYACQKCGKGFLIPSHATYHESQCSVGKRMNTKVQYKEIPGAKKPIKCAWPGCVSQDMYEKPSDSSLLKHHCKEHASHEEYLFHCHVCAMTFPHSRIRNDHVRMFCDLRYVCEVCNKPFAEPSLLRHHQDTIHRGVQPYACDQCEYRTKVRGAVSKHKQKVHGVKPPEHSVFCELCGQGFAAPHHLRWHKKYKHGSFKRKEKPILVCDECGYQTRDNSTMKNHRYNMHTCDGSQTVVCNECGVALKNRTSMYSHWKRFHADGVNKKPRWSAKRRAHQQAAVGDREVPKKAPKRGSGRKPKDGFTRIQPEAATVMHVTTGGAAVKQRAAVVLTPGTNAASLNNQVGQVQVASSGTTVQLAPANLTNVVGLAGQQVQNVIQQQGGQTIVTTVTTGPDGQQRLVGQDGQAIRMIQTPMATYMYQQAQQQAHQATAQQQAAVVAQQQRQAQQQQARYTTHLPPPPDFYNMPHFH